MSIAIVHTFCATQMHYCLFSFFVTVFLFCLPFLYLPKALRFLFRCSRPFIFPCFSFSSIVPHSSLYVIASFLILFVSFDLLSFIFLSYLFPFLRLYFSSFANTICFLCRVFQRVEMNQWLDKRIIH
jgi:hypothetical protein